ncbi:MAG: FdhF/YdeP family oxidoreductase [Myxococcota bacterium]|nr:FdhF/YdeP family oxidoreductase [Myxococcota bacterium]
MAALRSSLVHARREMGVGRGLRVLGDLNQSGGFDCPGCAWPDPERRSFAEFCENGAKHVAHEATQKRLEASFFEASTIPELLACSDRWLEAQGRLVEPLLKDAGSNTYRPVSWEDAYRRIAVHLQAVDSPDEAVFYTSGRTSNEAAFLYQLFARQFGTNNLPDCSNMCHESSGTGLNDAIGIGKGTVSLEDFDQSDLIFVIGQNPGSNHPRMLTTLDEARRRGCGVVSVNPLRERGLERFAHPKEPLALLGSSRPIADEFVTVRVGGDAALFKGIAYEVLALDRERGDVIDWDFVRERTAGFDAWRAALESADMAAIERQSGVAREQIRGLAQRYVEAERVIMCWAMGITQHRHGVANVQEIVNLLLLRGNIGRPGAGVCPVRGHSNVQGDRTMGIWEQPPPAFLDRLGKEFDFEAPREHGYDTVATLEAMNAGDVRVFFALGGNFAVATPDTERTHEALRRCDLTVHVATKLNRSHLVTGKEAIVLPCLGRTEVDSQPGGLQFVSVENSMSVVHRSQGRSTPADPRLRSEPRIIADLALATLGDSTTVPWARLADDYDEIRERIERVIPGFEEFNRRVRDGGFVLPSGARSQDFQTPDGKAQFRIHELPRLDLEPGQLLMMTIRSHDQFNTTIYSDDDRYRGIHNGRRVILLHSRDMQERGIEEGACLDLVSHFEGVERRAAGFTAIRYDVPLGCAATYFPEANGLVAMESFAEGSRTPAYKSVVITLESATNT